MTAKELERKLNLSAIEGWKYKVEEKDKEGASAKLEDGFITLNQEYEGEVIVYIVAGKSREVLFKIMPPNEDVPFWYLDTETSNCLFNKTSLPIYIKNLETALEFLNEKSNE